MVSEAVDRPGPPELQIQTQLFFLSGSGSFSTITQRCALFLFSTIFGLTSAHYIVAMGPAAKKRKVSKTEEVNFDPDARHEYLTGFRKRKQERIKHAQTAAEKRYREERRHDRAKVWFCSQNSLS